MPLIASTLPATPLSDGLLESLIDQVGMEHPGRPLDEVIVRDVSSNDIVELSFGNGHTLMVKQPRHYLENAQERFDACRRASFLLRRDTNVIAPAHLDVSYDADRPFIAYWRINLPTLDEVWPELSERGRVEILRDWGRLTRRIHQIRFEEFGAIAPEGSGTGSIGAFLRADLEERLMPAVMGEWERGIELVEGLLEAVAVVESRTGNAGVLNHNDLHMSNILCEVSESAVRCAGVLDLEAAYSAPAESELAKIAIYHGPLFGCPLAGSWFARLWEGYGDTLDPRVLAFFRAYHMVNIAFHSALGGNQAHAATIARSADEELGIFSRPISRLSDLRVP